MFEGEEDGVEEGDGGPNVDGETRACIDDEGAMGGEPLGTL